MNSEVMVLLDTDCSGRFFDLRIYNQRTFNSTHGLTLLCQNAWYENEHARQEALIPRYPAKARLALIRISIYAVDQAGIHGVMHISPSEYAVFRDTEEFERLINRVSANATRRQQVMERSQNRIPFSNGVASVF